MANPVEECLETYDAVERLAESNATVADYLQGISELIRNNPREALAAIASRWPTAEEMRALIGGLQKAEDQLSRRWDKLPEKYKSGILKRPDTAGADLGDRTFEDIQETLLEDLERALKMK